MRILQRQNLQVPVLQVSRVIRPRKGRPSNGSGLPMMLLYATRPVPFVRRHLNRHGRRKSKTGYGRMPSRLGTGYTTQAAMRKLQRTGRLQLQVGVRLRHGLERRIPFWARGRRRGPTLLGPMSESRWSLRERQCFNQVRYPGPCFLLVPRGAACMRWSWHYTLCLVVAFSRRLYCILRACTILRRLGDFSLSTSITIPVFHTILHRTFHKPMAIPRMALILVPHSLFSLDSPR